MSAALTTGLFALLGVIVGGLLNFMVTSATEERRGRRALRTAARIIGEELSTNHSILTATLEAGEWTPIGNAPLNFNAWRHHRNLLAERLPDDDWETVRHALEQAQMVDRVSRLESPHRPFSPADAPHLYEAQVCVGKATTMLESYSFTNGKRPTPAD